jgi:hypothetical protein
MKKSSNQKFLKWLMGGSIIAIAAISCQKHFDPNFTLPRQFKPGDINITTEETRAILSWLPSQFTSGKNVTYTVQVASDTTFQTTVLDHSISNTADTVTDDILQPRHTYYARVKANALDNTAASGWVVSDSFFITGEQIFFPLTSSDIIDNGVLLKWRTTPDVTKIVITPLSGGNAINVTLSPSDVTASQKIITGLSATTNYSAEIFSGNKSRGYLTFTTTAPLTGNLIDLRGIDGRPSVLADTLPLIPDNSTVILQRGETYTISATLNLSQSVTIVSGADLANPTPAVISLPSNFNITANSTIDHINFQNVDLIATSYSSKYVFNISALCTINTLSFDNCHIENLRGVCRIQTSGTLISNYSINNCIIDSVSNYGVLTVDNAGAKVDNVSLTNSTIYKTERVIISSKPTQGATSVLIDKCTFNETPYGNQTASFIVDYNTHDVTNGITISNCIFGIGKDNGGDVTVMDVRAGSATTITSANNYITSDRTVITNALTPVTTYTGTSLTLWVDPANGDFHFADNTFAGRNTAGDPRWK